MSYFADFDEFLKTQTSEKQKAQTQHVQNIRQSRQNLDPFINETFYLFKEYFEKILTPRHPYFLILKKKEIIDPITKDTPVFLYRVNIIPKQLLPGAFNPAYSFGSTHLTPREITDQDWHFHVSLQYDLALYDTYDEKTKTYSGKLSPYVFLRTWGNLEEEKQSLASSALTITTDTAWKMSYTQIKISQGKDELIEEYKNALFVVTPRVFSHLEEVWGIK